jgi:aspartyl-tRNA(Asn)/glutamyl-tRNA(Gln) amidotransferase subunit C
MVHFDQETLSSLEKLCHIQCTPNEEKELLHSLGKILDFVRQLNEVDTSSVSPCKYVLKDLIGTDLRDDLTSESLSRDQFLANAPDKLGSLIRVPPVMKSLQSLS